MYLSASFWHSDANNSGFYQANRYIFVPFLIFLSLKIIPRAFPKFETTHADAIIYQKTIMDKQKTPVTTLFLSLVTRLDGVKCVEILNNITGRYVNISLWDDTIETNSSASEDDSSLNLIISRQISRRQFRQGLSRKEKCLQGFSGYTPAITENGMYLLNLRHQNDDTASRHCFSIFKLCFC